MNIKFSRVIQGCMTWGIWGENYSPVEMAKRISENVDLGVSTFDHADIYGNYTTEETFGKALKQTKIARDQIQLISKCGIQLTNKNRGSYVKHYNYSKDYIVNQAEQSLINLKTDFLDLFLLHRPSPLMHTDEIAEAITVLHDSGKIKAFGVSNFTPQQIDYLSKSLDVEANQIQCSLIHKEPLEDDTLFYHQQNNILSMAWSPLGSFYTLNKGSELRLLINNLAKKYSCSETQIVLAWLMKHPAKIYPVLGTSKVERIKESNDAKKIEMSLQDWFLLYESSRGQEVN